MLIPCIYCRQFMAGAGALVGNIVFDINIISFKVFDHMRKYDKRRNS